MVWTKRQLEHLSKDKLIDEVMSIEDISSKLANLTTGFDNFSKGFEILSSERKIAIEKLQSTSKWTNRPTRKKRSQQSPISSTQIDKNKPCPCIN